MEFIVKRSRWLRGASEQAHRLRNESGHQCCLGFVCRQLGAKAAEILGKFEPCTVKTQADLSLLVRRVDNPLLLSTADTLFAEDAMEINDNKGIDDRQRERQLQALFRKQGHTISFVP